MAKPSAPWAAIAPAPTSISPDLSHDDRLRLMAALDDLLLPWGIDLSLQHELPESLHRHVARWAGGLPPKKRRCCAPVGRCRPNEKTA